MEFKLLSKLNEDQTPDGTYAAVKYTDQTTNLLDEYTKENKIPNPVKKDELHTTLLYSRKYLPKYKPQKYEQPIKAKFDSFDVWESRSDENDEISNVLVMKIKCPELEKRHEYLMKEHQATYDFPKYIPHITLSYDVGDLDTSNLSKIKDELYISHEYKEDLDL